MAGFDKAEFAINTVGINLGSRHLFGAWRFYELIPGSIILVYSDVQSYEKLVTIIAYALVYVLFHLST